MRFISPLLKRIIYPTLARAGYFRHFSAGGPAIVTYHGVSPAGYKSIDPDLDGGLVTVGALRQQLALLKSRYHLITPEEFRAWCRSKEALPGRSVLLTCDDGLENCVTDMLPVLADFGASCLFFVLGASASETRSLLWYEELYLVLLAGPERVSVDIPELGGAQHATGRDSKRELWSKLLKVLSAYDAGRRQEYISKLRSKLSGSLAIHLDSEAGRRRFQLMDSNGLSKLVAAGMTVGAHTNSHCMLSCAGDAIAWSEIHSSRTRLEAVLHQPVWAFAYPFGDPQSFSERDVALVERAGYECAFTNTGGGFGAAIRQYAVPRVHVTAEMNLGEFEAHLSGFYRGLRRRFSASELDVPKLDRRGMGA